MKKMQPIDEWLQDGFSYFGKNWVMLFKTSAWGLLMYAGVTSLWGIGIGLIMLLTIFLKIPVNTLTTTVAGIGWIIFVICLFPIAGKMLYLIILAVKNPIVDVRQTWREVTLKQGMSLYWLLMLSLFAGYGGMVFLIIPGLIVFNWVSMAPFIKVHQGIGGLQALMLSRDYVRGYFWQLVGRFFLIFLIVTPLTVIALFITGWLANIDSPFYFLAMVIYTVVMFAMMLVIYRLIYGIYSNLVDIKGKLELKATTGRTIRWSLLAYSPLVLMVISMIILFAISPSEQIQKAKDQAALMEVKYSPAPYVYHEPSIEQQQYLLALGAILSEQNNEDITVLRSSFLSESNLKLLVKEWWGITDRDSALESLNWLRDEGHRTEYMYMSEFLLGENVTTCAGLDNALEGCKDSDVKLLHDLARDIDALLGDKSIAAWDYGRLVNVARWSYTLGYISEEEAWTYIVPAARQAQIEYTSWEEYGKSYLLGRGYWMRDLKANEVQSEIFEYLTKPVNKTPWTTLEWQTNLD